MNTSLADLSNVKVEPNFKLTTDNVDLVINHTKTHTVFSLDVCLNDSDSFNLAQLIIDFLKNNCQSSNDDILKRKKELESLRICSKCYSKIQTVGSIYCIDCNYEKLMTSY